MKKYEITDDQIRELWNAAKRNHVDAYELDLGETVGFMKLPEIPEAPRAVAIPTAEMVHACTYHTDSDVVAWEVPMPVGRNVQLFAVREDIEAGMERKVTP